MPKAAEADEGTGPFTRPRGRLDAQEVWNRDERATTPEVSVRVANKGLTPRQEYLAHRAGRGEHISVTVLALVAGFARFRRIWRSCNLPRLIMQRARDGRENLASLGVRGVAGK